MDKLNITVYLTRLGSEVRMVEVECRCQDSTGNKIIWTSKSTELSSGKQGSQVFPWTKPARALLALLLSDLGQSSQNQCGLVGQAGSLARSLYELVTDKKAKGGGKSWLQKMFTDPNNLKEAPISTRLFHHEKRHGRFIVRLGPDWERAEVQVYLDNKKVLPGGYRDLSEEVKRWDAEELGEPKSTLSATLDLLVWRDEFHKCVSVREPGGRPLKAGDRTRVQIACNEEIHHYLTWLTLEQGKCLYAPFHPWNGNWEDFDHRKDLPCSVLALPQDHTQTFSELSGTAPSLETIILLARRTPLDLEVRKRMAIEFQTVVNSMRGKPVLENPMLMYDYVYPNNTGGPKASGGVRMFPDFKNTASIDDPIFQLHLALTKYLGANFDLIRTLTAANIGKTDKR